MCVSIGSGNTAVLIPASVNVIGVQIQTLVLSSGANAATPSGAFLVEDNVTDSDGNQYLGVEIGLCSTGGQDTDSATAPEENIVVPAGASLSVNNGGAGGSGALRRCTATVVYTILEAS
jgi:hypothetical protein